MTTDTLESIEIETGPEAGHAVIWLHGLGADGHDFAAVAPALGIADETPMRFVFPHAPMRPITINGGAVMRGWYDIADMDFNSRQDRAGMEQSAGILDGLIARENQRGVSSENIFLAGFSQGGAVVLHAGLRLGERLAGIIALSTYLPLADSLAAEQSAACQGTPIFVAHGVDDSSIPIQLGRASRQRLRQAGCAVEWREYPMAHSVSTEEIHDIGNFLRARCR